MTRVHGGRRLAARPGYEPLARVLDMALRQAQSGKGKQRHAAPGVAFVDQPIVRICELLGSTDFCLGQVIKKSIESKRLPSRRSRRELLGAINYAAAAVLVIQRRRRGSREAHARRPRLPRVVVVRRKGAKR